MWPARARGVDSGTALAKLELTGSVFFHLDLFVSDCVCEFVSCFVLLVFVLILMLFFVDCFFECFCCVF